MRQNCRFDESRFAILILTTRMVRIGLFDIVRSITMRERDTQRAGLYAADDVLRKHAKPLPAVDDMQAFVRKMWASKRVAASWPKAHARGVPKVFDGRGRSCAGGWDGGITMPLWSRRSDVVIHEIAHCIVWRELGSDIAGHGWQFCAVYLRLVLIFMGRAIHDELKASFKAHKVRYTAPRKRKPLSPEARAALIARLSV